MPVPHLYSTLRLALAVSLIALAAPLASAGERPSAGSEPQAPPAGIAVGQEDAASTPPGISTAAAGPAHSFGLAHPHCPHTGPAPVDRSSGAPAAALPRLPGQDAFGAIQEIVALLDADPATDWGAVDVRALRDHLVEMNELVLNAEVTETPVEGGFAAAITGAGRTLAAVRRMLPAHVSMLASEEPALRAEWKETAGGGTLTVTADAPAAVVRLRGLGFYGVMALGDHHRRHHLAIAAGRMRH
jgi:hypothetical protein